MNKPFKEGGPGMGSEEEYKLRIKRVLAEYPFLQPVVYGLSRMEAPESEWLETAAELSKGPFANEPDLLARATARDKDFATKYKFIMTSAIIENPTIPPEVKKKIVKLAYADPESQ